MRAPDRDLLVVVAELQQAITSGREPQLTTAEWDLLAAYIHKQSKPDRRGHSITRHIQGVNRSFLRTRMWVIKRKLRRDPAERDLKRTTRALGGRYVLNHRVAERMHDRLVKAGRKNIPSVRALITILSRSTANDPDEELWL